MLKGKVVAILNKADVVLNLGTREGVKKGMRFAIYELGQSIVDPETGADLGFYEAVKARISVYSVQEKLCVARVFADGPHSGLSFSYFLGLPPAFSTKHIKVGDRACQINLD